MPLKKLLDTVANTGSKIVAPGSSEAEGLKQKNQNIDEYKSTAVAEPSRAAEGTSADAVSPMAKYGDKPGEQRIDTSEMSKPLGAPVYDCGGMVYDKGGVVGQPSAAETHVHIHMPEQSTGDKLMRSMTGEQRPTNMYLADNPPAVQRPIVPMETSPVGKVAGAAMAPLYDDGGKVQQGVTLDKSELPLPEGARYSPTEEEIAAAGPKPLSAPKVNMETSPAGEAYGKAKYVIMHPLEQASGRMKSAYTAMPTYDDGGNVDE